MLDKGNYHPAGLAPVQSGRKCTHIAEYLSLGAVRVHQIAAKLIDDRDVICTRDG